MFPAVPPQPGRPPHMWGLYSNTTHNAKATNVKQPSPRLSFFQRHPKGVLQTSSAWLAPLHDRRGILVADDGCRSISFRCLHQPSRQRGPINAPEMGA